MSRYELLSTICMLLFLLCSTQKPKPTPTFTVSNSISECWGHSISFGNRLPGHIDWSHVAISFTLRCRSDPTKLGGIYYSFKLHECIFDDLWYLNLNGQRYNQCGSFNTDPQSSRVTMTCKNKWGNYEILRFDVAPFYSVNNGDAKCIRPYPK
jgi:hypothetical protein